ncbi:hypothetical protein DMC30DRAFT_441937 [Rhodotorula diobovata]|uniref:Myb-like domain-containing protein n=1 Tax=Rhodotorula diobovata TaxID=5288 RepID=A0A5C5FS73_9BASI|nr:hypothetical protein DMC30DRAFT_441937 [Rhodotorula diobovata]
MEPTPASLAPAPALQPTSSGGPGDELPASSSLDAEPALPDAATGNAATQQASFETTNGTATTAELHPERALSGGSPSPAHQLLPAATVPSDQTAGAGPLHAALPTSGTGLDSVAAAATSPTASTKPSISLSTDAPRALPTAQDADADANAHDSDPDSPLTPLASSSPESSPSRPPPSKRPRVRSPSPSGSTPTSASAPPPAPAAAAAAAAPLKANYRRWTPSEDALLSALRRQTEAPGWDGPIAAASFDQLAERLGRSATAVSIHYYTLKRKEKEAEEAEGGEGATSLGDNKEKKDKAVSPSGSGASPAFSAAPVTATASPSTSTAPAAARAPSAPRTDPTLPASLQVGKAPRRYTDAEDARVEELHNLGWSAAQIGAEIGRSANSVYNRCVALESMGRNVSSRMKKVGRKG